MPGRSSATNAAEKACRILCALSDPRTRRLTDIAASTGLHKVSVLRVLEVLVAEGLVERDEDKLYRYGAEVRVMAASMNARDDLRAIARPSLRRLAEDSGDTVLLVEPHGMECVCLDRLTGDYPIHASTLHIGSRRPLGIGSGPMAVLAWLGPADQRAAMHYVKDHLQRFPRLSMARIEAGIRETRDRGCAIQYDEVVSQVGAIGMPILDPQGRPVGALSISSLSPRIREREEELSTLLAREVAVVRRAMGQRTPEAVR
ncbi:IclR family transcriptional regulator [Pseudorhodoferax sp.]|uniref:IclR family transcriptional regulator n=1 Tax=Pseudorhodoferax sp. TaxID=1993553 RepID=UPI002DD61F04|nr:IclR family transcriptional regulator [Pseudorhodoferax sp.]